MKELKNFIRPGKMNLIIDGQFGSTGKGLIAVAISEASKIDVSIARLSPNSGHTFYRNGRKVVLRMLPVSGIMQKDSLIYLCAGSVIDPDVLFHEMSEHSIPRERVVLHPRAAVIFPETRDKETTGEIGKIGSTLTGTGAARAEKVMRENPLVQGCPELFRGFVVRALDIPEVLRKKAGVLVETSQGFDLGLNHGFSYPFCTSTDVVPAAVLSDIGAHPYDIGNTMMSIRSFPIRVGNVFDEQGTMVGFSGNVYDDSREITWDELGQPEERTTVTERVRRVFTFSMKQYARSLEFVRPSHVFLNFFNYFRKKDLDTIREICKIRKPDFVGTGKYITDIVPWSDRFMEEL